MSSDFIKRERHALSVAVSSASSAVLPGQQGQITACQVTDGKHFAEDNVHVA